MKNEILIYNQTRRKIPRERILRVVSETLEFLKLKQPVELAVLIVGKETMKRLNKFWRGKNRAADELSFGLNSRQTPKFAKDFGNVLILGEIVINAEKISDPELLRKILVHGLLHLLGYDHEKSERSARRMENLEEKILKFLD